MRDLIFRGKQTDSGEWIRGFFFEKPNAFSERGDPTTYCIADLPPFGCAVRAETVGQYTGLRDKNGTMIFEGDIVSGLFRFGMSINAVVAFQNGAFGVITSSAKEFMPFTSVCCVEWEVIGNIFDNENIHVLGIERNTK